MSLTSLGTIVSGALALGRAAGDVFENDHYELVAEFQFCFQQILNASLML